MNYAAIALVVTSLATPAFAKRAAPVDDSPFIAGSGVNFRAAPSPSGKVLFRMPYGTRVEAIRHDGKFTEVTLVDAPEVRGFVGRRLVQGLRGPTAKEQALMRALLTPKDCPLPKFTPNCDISGVHPEEYFSAVAKRCRNSGSEDCEQAFERKRNQERTDALERIAFFWPKKLTPALQIELLQVMAAVAPPKASSSLAPELTTSRGHPYGTLPRQVLQNHAFLRAFAAPQPGSLKSEVLDEESSPAPIDAKAWVAAAKACVEMPTPKGGALSGHAQALEVDVTGGASRHFANMGQRLAAVARRSGGTIAWTVSKAPMCGPPGCESASRIAATREEVAYVLDAKRVTSGPAQSNVRLALFAEPNVNYVDAKGALVASPGSVLLFGKPIESLPTKRPAEAPTARSLAAAPKPANKSPRFKERRPENPCRDLTATGFDVDGDGVDDVVSLRQEILESEENYRVAVLISDGKSWIVRYFFGENVYDI